MRDLDLSEKPWMVQRKSGLAGPYSTEDLRKEIAAGRVLRSDQVRFGQGGFRRISEFSALAVSAQAPKKEGASPRTVLVSVGVVFVVVAGLAVWLLTPKSGPSKSSVPPAVVALVQNWPMQGAVPTRSAQTLRNELDDAGCARKAQQDFSQQPNLFSLALFSDCIALFADPQDAKERQQLFDQLSAFISSDPHVSLLLPSKALLANSLGKKEDARLAISAAATELRGDPRADLVEARLSDNQEKIAKLAQTQLEAFALVVKRDLDNAQFNDAFSELQSALSQPGERKDFALASIRRLARTTFLGDVLWRDLAERQEPVFIAEVGFLSSPTETAQSQRAFFEPRLADPKVHAWAALGVAALLVEGGRDPEARAELQETQSLPPDSGRCVLAAVLALRQGNVDEAEKQIAQAGDLLEARYFAAVVKALRGDTKPMQALLPEIPGPLPSLVIAAVSKEHDQTLRLENLLGRDDGLAEMNPGDLPLFDGGLRAFLPKLVTSDDAVVRALMQMWLNENPPPVSGAPWFAGVFAYEKKQYTRAAQILGPLAHGDEAEPAVLGLYGRVMEKVEPDWAEDFYHDLAKDGDNSEAADLGHLRMTKDKAKAEERALAMWKNGMRGPLINHALYHEAKK